MSRSTAHAGEKVDRQAKDLPVPLHLELVDATTYRTGVAIHVYRPR